MNESGKFRLNNIRKTARASVVAVALGVAMVAGSSAKAENLTALVYQGNQIFTFDSSNPGTILTSDLGKCCRGRIGSCHGRRQFGKSREPYGSCLSGKSNFHL